MLAPPSAHTVLLPNFALLIDGDQQQVAAGAALRHLAEKGNVLTRQVFARRDVLSAWGRYYDRLDADKHVSGDHVDFEMQLCAIDLAREVTCIDSYCLVSGDKDFAGLASWLQGQGKDVIVASVVPHSNRLLSLHGIEPLTLDPSNGSLAEEAGEQLRAAFEVAPAFGGWKRLNDINNLLRQQDADFNPREFGRSQLVDLFEDLRGEYEVEERVRIRARLPANGPLG
jgi:hypothetical protein